MQTVFRAELLAICHVVLTATAPTHIASDCGPVVKCAATISHGNHQVFFEGDHADVWEDVHEKVKQKDQGHFKLTWVPSHTDLTKAREQEARGGPP